MSEVSSPPTTPKPRRWRQFSLRTLMVVTAFVAAGLSWLAVKIRQAGEQRRAVEAVQKLRGAAWYDYQANENGTPEYYRPLIKPAFLRDWFGTNFFHPIVGVSFSTGELTISGWGPETRISEENLQCLEGLVNLKALCLRRQPVGDKGLVFVCRLSELESLYMAETRITDNGLGHLKGLKQLRVLDLSNTQVTDAGLVHLRGLTKLSELDLSNTQVTDAGVDEFQKALPKVKITR